MTKLNFEIYVNDYLLETVHEPSEMLATDEWVANYLNKHPEIDRETAKVSVKIVKSDCKTCS
jgi:hypothetical protein